MKKVSPIGLSHDQWMAITQGLEDNPMTINDYRKVINLLQNYAPDRFTILTMTVDDAREYFQMLENKAKDGQISINTVHRYEATLRAVGRRIASHPQLFPNYTSPFTGLMHEETRNKTSYKGVFADAKDIQKIISILPSFQSDRKILLEMLVFVGLRSKNIEDITFKDFQMHNQRLILTIYDYANTKSTVKNKTNTFKWIFFASYSAILKYEHPLLGTLRDNRKYFLTVRRQPFTYRAQRFIVKEACIRAGLSPTQITPYQLSLYGIITSYLLMNNLKRHDDLKKQLAYAKTIEERNGILKELRTSEKLFIPLAQDGWIGEWEDRRLPDHMQAMIDEIVRQLGEKALYKAIGIDYDEIVYGKKSG